MHRKQLAAAVLAACGLVGAAGSANGGEATPGDARGQDDVAAVSNQAHRAWLGETMVQLADSGSARELALAALLWPLAARGADGTAPATASPEAMDWARRASALAGADPIANHLLVGGLPRRDSGEVAALRRDAVARWRAAEPDNLAPLLYSELQPRELVAAAANVRRHDLHYVETVRAVARMLAAHPPLAAMPSGLSARADAGAGTSPMDADERALLEAAGLAVAFLNPGLRQLVEACSPDALDADAARRADCGLVAGVMRAASDTELGEGLGRGLALRVASPAELPTIAEEARRHAWRRRQMATATSGGDAQVLVKYYADASIDTEQALARRVISDAGLPLLPPADWKPPQAR